MAAVVVVVVVYIEDSPGFEGLEGPFSCSCSCSCLPCFGLLDFPAFLAFPASDLGNRIDRGNLADSFVREGLFLLVFPSIVSS